MSIDFEQPLQVFVDNQACIALSKNFMNHGKTKHFALKVHFIQKLVDTGPIQLNYLPTDRMPTDTLTKAKGRTETSLFRAVLLGLNTQKDRGCIKYIILIV